MFRSHVLALVAAGAVALLSSSAAAAAPNLVTAKVSDPPRSAPEGGSFRISDTAANRGRSRAGAGDTRFYLSPDGRASLRERRASRTNPRSALADLLLTGARRVPALAPSRSSRARGGTLVRVPYGTPPGVYDLLACADDRGAVRERAEGDNCRKARRRITITASPIAGPLVVQGLGNATPDRDEADDREEVELTRLAVCAPLPRAPRVPSLASAVKRARAHLTRTAGRDAMRAFERSRDYRSAAASEHAAGAAMAIGEPGAALAAMLRAHRLEPREASHLVNAAAAATAVGLPAEALAMLDAAARLDDRDIQPLGMPRQAVALANRGHALASLGRRAEAERALEAALRLEPLLSEAESGLAALRACAADTDGAVRLLRRSRKRRSTPTEEPPPLDESQGRESTVRELPLPANPRVAADQREFYWGLADQEGAAIQRQSARENELVVALNGRPNAVSERFRSAILRRAYAVREDALQQRFFAAIDRVQEIHDKTWGGGAYLGMGDYQRFQQESNDECEGSEDYEECYEAAMRQRCVPQVRSQHQAWLDRMTEAQAAAQAYFRPLSRRYTAIVSNLGNPQAHEYAMLHLQALESGTYGSLVQQAQFWTHYVNLYRDRCVESGDPAAQMPGAPAFQAQTAGACPGEIKALSFVWALGPAKLKANCEELTVEFAGGPNEWVKAFAEVKYNARTGRLTVFGGSKLSVGGVVQGGFKSGVYVTVDNRGITDAGWRVGPSATVSKGPFEVKAKDEIDISFVGAFGGPGS